MTARNSHADMRRVRPLLRKKRRDRADLA
jgi:hypothetical protein